MEEIQLLLAIFTVLQAANLALWTTPSVSRTRTSIAAATMSFVAAVALGGLSYMEHMRSIRPSPIINAYLLLTLPLDFAQVRTLWLRQSSSAVAAVFTSASAVKFAILVAEAVEKGGLLLSPFEIHAPESTSGVYSRALFWWLNPLFLLGYKHVLSNDGLFDTDEKLMSKPVYRRFQPRWAKSTAELPFRHHYCLYSDRSESGWQISTLAGDGSSNAFAFARGHRSSLVSYFLPLHAAFAHSKGV